MKVYGLRAAAGAVFNKKIDQQIVANADQSFVRQCIKLDYNADVDDAYIGLRHSTPIFVNLPHGENNKIMIFKDELGVCHQYAVKINAAPGETIELNDSFTLSAKFQSLTLIFGDGNWSIIQ